MTLLKSLTLIQVEEIISILKTIRKEGLIALLFSYDLKHGKDVTVSKEPLLEIIKTYLIENSGEELAKLQKVISETLSNASYNTSKTVFRDRDIESIFKGNLSIFETKQKITLETEDSSEQLNKDFSFEFFTDISRSETFSTKNGQTTIKLQTVFDQHIRNLLYSGANNNPTNYKILLYCFRKSNINNPNSFVNLCFPKSFTITINKAVLQSTKAMFYGDTEMISIMPYLTRKGGNYAIKMEFPSEELRGYILGTALFKHLTDAEKLKKICNEVSQEDVMRSWEMDSNSSSLKYSSFSLSLNCPISLKRIRYPIKGRDCKHPRCFDAEEFLKIIKSNVNECPICHIKIEHKQESYIYDTHFLSILNNSPQSTCSVLLDRKAKVLQHKANENIIDLTDDTEAPLSNLEIKPESNYVPTHSPRIKIEETATRSNLQTPVRAYEPDYRHRYIKSEPHNRKRHYDDRNGYRSSDHKRYR